MLHSILWRPACWPHSLYCFSRAHWRVSQGCPQARCWIRKQKSIGGLSSSSMLGPSPDHAAGRKERAHLGGQCNPIGNSVRSSRTPAVPITSCNKVVAASAARQRIPWGPLSARYTTVVSSTCYGTINSTEIQCKQNPHLGAIRKAYSHGMRAGADWLFKFQLQIGPLPEVRQDLGKPMETRSDAF